MTAALLTLAAWAALTIDHALRARATLLAKEDQ